LVNIEDSAKKLKEAIESPLAIKSSKPPPSRKSWGLISWQQYSRSPDMSEDKTCWGGLWGIMPLGSPGEKAFWLLWHNFSVKGSSLDSERVKDLVRGGHLHPRADRNTSRGHRLNKERGVNPH